jgi:hypothetical protein
MRSIRIALLLAALAGFCAPAVAENSQGCEGANCVAPVYVDPNQPECEGEDCPQAHPAIECEGQNCLAPQDNPVETCEGENCAPAPIDSGPMEECEGQGCELAPPSE